VESTSLLGQGTKVLVDAINLVFKSSLTRLPRLQDARIQSQSDDFCCRPWLGKPSPQLVNYVEKKLGRVHPTRKVCNRIKEKSTTGVANANI
jgi:hypothetical protein